MKSKELKEIRKQLGLTQAELAEKMGYRRLETISEKEAGNRSISKQDEIILMHLSSQPGSYIQLIRDSYREILNGEDVTSEYMYNVCAGRLAACVARANNAESHGFMDNFLPDKKSNPVKLFCQQLKKYMPGWMYDDPESRRLIAVVFGGDQDYDMYEGKPPGVRSGFIVGWTDEGLENREK